MKADLALRQRLMSRFEPIDLETPIELQLVPRKPFDASVRQADMGAGCYQVTTVMGDGSKHSRAAIGNPKLLADAAYDAGAKGVTVMVLA